MCSVSCKPSRINFNQDPPNISYLLFHFNVIHDSWWRQSHTVLLQVKPSNCHWALCSPSGFCLSQLFSASLPHIQWLLIIHSTELYSAAATVLQKPMSMWFSAFHILPASAQTHIAIPAHSMREQPPHINNLLFLLSIKKRLHSLLAFPQDKLTRLEGSVHGLCILVEARNLQPRSKWREWRKQLLCDGPPVLIVLSRHPTITPTSILPVAACSQNTLSLM